MCDYIFQNGKKCQQPSIQNSNLCILHAKIPSKEDTSYNDIISKKNQRIEEKIQNGDFNFEGAILDGLNLEKKVFDTGVNFLEAQFEDSVNFNGAIFKQEANFNEAIFKTSAFFCNVNFLQQTFFEKIHFKKGVQFKNTKFCGCLNSFRETEFGDRSVDTNATSFENTFFKNGVIFDGAIFNWFTCFKSAYFAAKIDYETRFDKVIFDATIKFNDAIFEKYTSFSAIDCKREICFKNTIFKNPKSQEEACRLAKICYEKLGNKKEADYYYYHEMDGTRKTQKWWLRYPELFIQYLFFYGTKPGLFFMNYATFILFFATLYAIFNTGENWVDYIYFSLLGAMIPGLLTGSISSTTKGLVVLEALTGIFMWAVFITIFTRKYSR